MRITEEKAATFRAIWIPVQTLVLGVALVVFAQSHSPGMGRSIPLSVLDNGKDKKAAIQYSVDPLSSELSYRMEYTRQSNARRIKRGGSAAVLCVSPSHPTLASWIVECESEQTVAETTLPNLYSYASSNNGEYLT